MEAKFTNIACGSETEAERHVPYIPHKEAPKSTVSTKQNNANTKQITLKPAGATPPLSKIHNSVSESELEHTRNTLNIRHPIFKTNKFDTR